MCQFGDALCKATILRGRRKSRPRWSKAAYNPGYFVPLLNIYLLEGRTTFEELTLLVRNK